MLEIDSKFSIGKVTGSLQCAVKAMKCALEMENKVAFTLEIYHVVLYDSGSLILFACKNHTSAKAQNQSGLLTSSQ